MHRKQDSSVTAGFVLACISVHGDFYSTADLRFQISSRFPKIGVQGSQQTVREYQFVWTITEQLTGGPQKSLSFRFQKLASKNPTWCAGTILYQLLLPTGCHSGVWTPSCRSILLVSDKQNWNLVHYNQDSSVAAGVLYFSLSKTTFIQFQNPASKNPTWCASTSLYQPADLWSFRPQQTSLKGS